MLHCMTLRVLVYVILGIVTAWALYHYYAVEWAAK